MKNSFLTTCPVLRVHYSAEGKKIYLKDTWSPNDPRVKASVYDSGYFVNGLVHFNGNFEDYKYYSLSFDSDKYFFPFIIDTGKIMIVGDASAVYQSEVYNSFQNALEEKYRVVVDSFFSVREQLQDSLMANENLKNLSAVSFFSNKINCIDSSLAEYIFTVAIQTPNCYYVFKLVKDFFNLTKVTKQISKKTFFSFSSSMQNSEEGAYLHYLLFDFDQSNLIGRKFEKIILTNVKNIKEMIKLEEGKITLIDYWASWCGPCIATFPELKRLFLSYSKNSFSIVSISLDSGFSVWKKSLQKYVLPWKNYLSLGGFESAQVKKYGIAAIPFTLLLDKNGVIMKISPSISEIEKYINENALNPHE
ncbi:MAG: TlpA disulfide reductase family protein [Sediminibacterium sp.]|nr:TlpA disulfide reductase family protein [Sediminibacterium sp.]